MTEYTVTYTAEITEIYKCPEPSVTMEEHLMHQRKQLIEKGDIRAAHVKVKDYKVFVNDKTKNKNKP